MKTLKSLVSQLVSSFTAPRTFEQSLEAQNTRKVYFPRVHGLVRTYTYGKAPGESLLKGELHPEGKRRPSCEPERNPAVIRDHIAICSREKGSMGGLCEMCQKLNNPQRRAFLMRLYGDSRPLDQAGFNVGDAADKSVLNQPATSQYLRQLAAMGLIRRERHGRIVFYVPEVVGRSTVVGEIGEMMRERWRADRSDEAFVPVFRVMMGPFRAHVVRLLAGGGSGAVEDLAEHFGKRAYEIMRDLDEAVKGGILSLSSEDAGGIYRYVTPADPIARRIIELA